MAIIGYRVSYEFALTQDLSMGWSENYWSGAGSLAAAITAATNLQAFRMALLPSQVTNTFIRVSAFPFGTRLAQILPVSQLQGLAQRGQASQTGISQGWTKALMRLVGTGGQVTRQWLGGLPSGNMNNNGQWNPVGFFQSALNSFYAALNVQGFCVRKIAQAGAAAKTRLTSITQTGTLVAAGNTVGGSPNLVSVTGIESGFGVRGVWPVATNDGTNITVIGLPALTAAIPGNRKSFVQQYSSILVAIGNNSALIQGNMLPNGVERVTKHNIGRIFGQASGRRKLVKK